MNAEVISKEIIQNLIEVLAIAISNASHPEATMQNQNGSLHYFSGCEFPFFNGIFNNYQQSKATVTDDLIAANEYFSTKNVPYIWWWTQQSDIPLDMQKNLSEQGFQFLGDFAGIALQLNEMNAIDTSDAVRVKKIEQADDYHTYMTIMCDVFQLSDSIKKDLTAMYDSYGPQSKFTHYLAFHNDKPVATLTSYIKDSVVGLYNGSTLPDFQKIGACSKLVQIALNEAKHNGCKYAISQLMAPGMAKGLCEKLGFKTYCKLLPFLKDPRINTTTK